MACEKCDLLIEMYNQVPYSARNYWVMTELFVMLHGSDTCDGYKEIIGTIEERPDVSELGEVLATDYEWHCNCGEWHSSKTFLCPKKGEYNKETGKTLYR